jgi:hypothetical protein
MGSLTLKPIWVSLLSNQSESCQLKECHLVVQSAAAFFVDARSLLEARAEHLESSVGSITKPPYMYHAGAQGLFLCYTLMMYVIVIA